ncbi:methyltransferase domain-containing protein [Kribbella ginsengisoli]|uniref:Methyltransferase type 11 domain-containing protein n=1 Tax=Kribbella ginsengisoli TaxID=363865 RepID=A0ABP6Z4Y0_9ACTN
MSEQELDESRVGFKLRDADREDGGLLAMVLDLMAAKPSVRTLKAWALDALAPAVGEAALDVGSGTGEDLAELLDRVGPSGRAVGVEPNRGLRTVARERHPSLELVDGIASALPFDGASFDVVRCERVLQHVDDAPAAAGEMARVLRPGGRICLIDTDWATAIVHPADPEVLGRMIDFFHAESANPYSGRTLRGLLADAGLTVAGETAATWIEPQSGAKQGFLSMMGKTSAAAGVITAAEAEAFHRGLEEAADRGAFHMSLTMYAVAATKSA